MPELPEIETVRMQLDKVIKGAKLQGVKVLSNKTVRGDLNELIRRKVVRVERRGKVLLINFGQDLKLGFHFKMTGQLIYEGVGGPARNASIRVAGGHPKDETAGGKGGLHRRWTFGPLRRARE